MSTTIGIHRVSEISIERFELPSGEQMIEVSINQGEKKITINLYTGSEVVTVHGPAVVARAPADSLQVPTATISRWRDRLLGKGWPPRRSTIRMCQEVADEMGEIMGVMWVAGETL